jgi:hypothetical protein
VTVCAAGHICCTAPQRIAASHLLPWLSTHWPTPFPKAPACSHQRLGQPCMPTCGEMLCPLALPSTAPIQYMQHLCCTNRTCTARYTHPAHTPLLKPLRASAKPACPHGEGAVLPSALALHTAAATNHSMASSAMLQGGTQGPWTHRHLGPWPALHAHMVWGVAVPPTGAADCCTDQPLSGLQILAASSTKGP